MLDTATSAAAARGVIVRVLAVDVSLDVEENVGMRIGHVLRCGLSHSAVVEVVPGLWEGRERETERGKEGGREI